MAEKTFRQIEAEITEKGFSTLCKEAAESIQNCTRMLSYLAADHIELTDSLAALTGQLIISGVKLIELSKKID